MRPKREGGVDASVRAVASNLLKYHRALYMVGLILQGMVCTSFVNKTCKVNFWSQSLRAWGQPSDIPGTPSSTMILANLAALLCWELASNKAPQPLLPICFLRHLESIQREAQDHTRHAAHIYALWQPHSQSWRGILAPLPKSRASARWPKLSVITPLRLPIEKFSKAAVVVTSSSSSSSSSSSHAIRWRDFCCH